MKYLIERAITSGSTPMNGSKKCVNISIKLTNYICPHISRALHCITH